MRVLIDGDPIVYRCGFAGQNDWKILQWTDVMTDAEGPFDVHREECFLYVWEMEQYIEQMNLHPDEYSVEKWVDPLAESFVLKMVKDSLRTTVAAVEGYLAETEKKVESVEVYLSGSTNFRNGIATIPTFKKDGTAVQGYKANRKDNDRPYWYKRIRDYMIERWDAVVFEGIEADDALAIQQWAEDEYDPQTIIATIDKDLLNVPGWHYNVLKKDSGFVTFKDAQVNFYRQCLTGDTTDNIPGLYRVGKKKAEALIHEGMTEQEMYDTVLVEYIKNIEKFPERHGPYGARLAAHHSVDAVKCARGSLLENARLLWMIKHKDQLWSPPGEPDGSIADAHLFDVEDEWDE